MTRSGPCSGSTHWKIRAKPDDGRIEVEAEIDSNVNGQRWSWVLAPAADLTPREREVLALVRAGPANKQIARRLDISERTVKAHLTSVFTSIGVADRTWAALWAERHDVGGPERSLSRLGGARRAR